MGSRRERLDALEERTRRFATDAYRLARQLRREPGLEDLASQLSRAAGSVSSNHRAMRRARTTREFAAKLYIVCEEIDECPNWLHIARDLCPYHGPSLDKVLNESLELRSIFARARSTTRRRLEQEARDRNTRRDTREP